MLQSDWNKTKGFICSIPKGTYDTLIGILKTPERLMSKLPKFEPKHKVAS